MPDFPIVDTHVHLYDPAAVEYGWMAGVPLLNKRHASEEYTAAIGATVVEKLVFVEVDASPGRHLDEARWVSELAKTDSRIGGIVGSVPLENGSIVEADIAAFAAMPLARGVRRLMQGHVDEPGWSLRPDFLEGVRLVGEHGLGFEICIYHPQMAEAVELVKRSPDTMSFVLNHIGKPGIRDGLAEPWRKQMRELAALPNVVCKISGVVTEDDPAAWSYDRIAPYIEHAVAAFGSDRVMFGGDWPVVLLACPYVEWVSVMDRIMSGATDSERRKLYRDNAIAHYRL